MSRWSDATQERAREFISRYPEKKSAVMPLLYLAMAEEGHLTNEGMEEVADWCGMTPAQVQSVASFYTMLKKQPTGKYLFQVCHTLSCALRGADALVEMLEGKLGIQCGETTEDGMFTLSEVECLAACVNAPVAWIGDDFYEDLDGPAMTKLLDDVAAGKAKPGPQVKRQTSAPVSGAKTLKKGA